MRKNLIKDIEKIREQWKLPQEIKNNIVSRIIANWAICIAILILIFTFRVAQENLPKEIIKIIYSISSIISIVSTITLIEIAYKKDSSKYALTSVEMIVISVFVLFTPHILIGKNNIFVYIFMAFITVYYIIKIICIYNSEKKKFLNKINDITDIIKKESMDKLAEQEKEKRKEEKNKKQTNKKVSNKKKTDKKVSTKKKIEEKPKKSEVKKTRNTTKKTEQNKKKSKIKENK